MKEETVGGNQSCFIFNWDTKDANVAFNGKAYKIPAWSVSILPDCNDEVYNTAKLNTQTSLMARRAANLVGEEPETLHWQWRSEIFNHIRPKGRENVVGDYTTNKLMDQKEVANDTSDYLWYITK
ncbi:Beta-galactosidase 7 [Ancistrocladus abbreviatus]